MLFSDVFRHQSLCTKRTTNKNLMQFLSNLFTVLHEKYEGASVSESISELLDLVCLSALNLYLHLTHSQGCLRQQWGMRCERRGQRWHLTPFHFLDSDVPFILKCQQVHAVLMGVSSAFSQTGVIFVCFFSTEVSHWATHACQMPLNLFHVVFSLFVTFL